MDINLIKELADVLNDKALNELDYSIDNCRIILKKNNNVNSNIILAQNADTEVSITPSNTPSTQNADNSKNANAEDNIDDEKITASIIGTFYDKPAPDEESFVTIGTKVKKGDVLCIIESMKLMNEIKAPFDCVITSIYVDNEEVVEFGQELFGVKVM